LQVASYKLQGGAVASSKLQVASSLSLFGGGLGEDSNGKKFKVESTRSCKWQETRMRLLYDFIENKARCAGEIIEDFGVSGEIREICRGICALIKTDFSDDRKGFQYFFFEEFLCLRKELFIELKASFGSSIERESGFMAGIFAHVDMIGVFDIGEVRKDEHSCIFWK
jgi:hypothetical protein